MCKICFGKEVKLYLARKKPLVGREGKTKKKEKLIEKDKENRNAGDD